MQPSVDSGKLKLKQKALPWALMLILFFVVLFLAFNNIDQQDIKKIGIAKSSKSTNNNTVGTPQPDSKGKVRVLIAGLRLRSTPVVSENMVLSLSRGTELDIIDEQTNGWFKVRAPSGAEGYVSSSPKYVERIK